MFLKRIKNKKACTLFVVGYNKVVLEIRNSKGANEKEPYQERAHGFPLGRDKQIMTRERRGKLARIPWIGRKTQSPTGDENPAVVPSSGSSLKTSQWYGENILFDRFVLPAKSFPSG